jgi:hypothetical protein
MAMPNKDHGWQQAWWQQARSSSNKQLIICGFLLYPMGVISAIPYNNETRIS